MSKPFNSIEEWPRGEQKKKGSKKRKKRQKKEEKKGEEKKGEGRKGGRKRALEGEGDWP